MEYNSVPILRKIIKRQSQLKSRIKSTQDAQHLISMRSRLQGKHEELELIKHWIEGG